MFAHECSTCAVLLRKTHNNRNHDCVRDKAARMKKQNRLICKTYKHNKHKYKLNRRRRHKPT